MLDWSGAPALLCSTWADWGRGASWRRSMPRHPRNANGRWDGARGPEWSSVRARRASRRAAAGASRSTRIAAQRPTDSSTWRTCRRSGWGCTSACRRLFGGLLPRELPQHVLEDPAVPVVLELLWGVDPQPYSFPASTTSGTASTWYCTDASWIVLGASSGRWTVNGPSVVGAS